MQTKVFVWLSHILGVGYVLAVVIVCFETFRRGQSLWLLPAIIGGSAALVWPPALALLIWGKVLLKKVTPDQRASIKRSIAFSSIPLVVCVIGFIGGFIVVMLAPPGMTTRSAG